MFFMFLSAQEGHSKSQKPESTSSYNYRVVKEVKLLLSPAGDMQERGAAELCRAAARGRHPGKSESLLHCGKYLLSNGTSQLEWEARNRLSSMWILPLRVGVVREVRFCCCFNGNTTLLKPAKEAGQVEKMLHLL